MRESGNVFMEHFLGMPFLGEDAVHFFAFFKDISRASFQSHAGIPFKPTVILVYYVFSHVMLSISTRMHLEYFSNANTSETTVDIERHL